MFPAFISSLRTLATVGNTNDLTPEQIWNSGFVPREEVTHIANTVINKVMTEGERSSRSFTLIEDGVVTRLSPIPGGSLLSVTNNGNGYVDGMFPSAIVQANGSLTFGYGIGTDQLESRIHWSADSTIVEAPGLRAVFKEDTLLIRHSAEDGDYELLVDANASPDHDLIIVIKDVIHCAPAA
jgi:hypothetical protein